MIWHMAGLSYWAGNFRGILRRATGRLDESFYATDRVKRSVILEARIVLAIYAAALIGSIAAGSTLLLWYWVIPALLGQPMLRLYLICEHGGCPRTADMFENTRTTYTNASGALPHLERLIPRRASRLAVDPVPRLAAHQRADPRPAAHDRARLSRGAGGNLADDAGGKNAIELADATTLHRHPGLEPGSLGRRTCPREELDPGSRPG